MLKFVFSTLRKNTQFGGSLGPRKNHYLICRSDVRGQNKHNFMTLMSSRNIIIASRSNREIPECS